MATKDPRTTPCDASRRAGRLAKARQFIDAADTVATLDDDNRFNDVLITLYVHAGIAAADVICCSKLGKHARGESHDEAVRLLGRADATAAKHLGVLLKMKTRSGYSSLASTQNERTRAHRAAESLMSAAAEQ